MPALFSHATPDAVIAHEQGRAITAREYLAAVQHMAARLPTPVSGTGHVLNMCGNRYHFAVVLGAALLRGQPVLLPSTRTPEMQQQLHEAYAGLHAVVDETLDTGPVPQIRFESGPPPDPAEPFEVPRIDPQQVYAYVFTSGSTGRPVAHAKHWGLMVQAAQAAGRRVRQHLLTQGHAPDASFTVTGTVPAQHMFGFEFTVMMPLHSQAALDASRPFYPADIAAALAGVPAPRMLISTPFHLRTLVESGVPQTSPDLVMSATAPLSPQLARQTEEVLRTTLLEIYGCTECGQVASRRPAVSELWQTLPGLVISEQTAPGGEPTYVASGGHVAGQVPLADVLDLRSPTTFALLGRHADMVNIAGKRTSMAYLNHQLNSIPGVLDGALYWPQDAEQDARARNQRPVAFVVAPELNEADLQHALRERIDPAFLPRPIHYLSALPRNSTGKLTQQVLADLAQQHKRAPSAAPQQPAPAPARWKVPPLVHTTLGVHALAGVGLFTPAWPWSLGVLGANHAVLAATGLWPRSTWLGANLTHLPRERAEVAITIDDGPDPEVTPAVLDLLDELQVQATFFCIGAHVQRHPALAREILKRGHAMGNHSQHHRHHFSVMGPGPMRREIASAQDSIAEITGVAPTFFRAPAGLRNLFLDPVLHGLGLKLASWTRRGFDTRTGNAGLVLQRLTRGLAAGDILLLHDHHAALTPAGRPVLLDVLPPLVATLRAQGLTPVRLTPPISHTS
jgi:acyl-coenzyme A synthetase/AMP-(fatty) acid ligase/peptidoglycan/xylan/chitin deacetylase (PgdA/CDA1 family)